jgi:hypothetical protein
MSVREPLQGRGHPYWHYGQQGEAMDEDQRSYEQMNRRLDDQAKRIEAESQTAKEFRISTRESIHKYKGSVETLTLSHLNHDRDIKDTQGDVTDIKKEYTEALGQKGWVGERLSSQDAKWTRIYFLIVSLLLSIITLTVTLWVTTASGGK